MKDIQLLFFEAASCLMAVPASEVTRLEGSDPLFTKIENASTLDLDEYFTREASDGPWLQWRRGAGRAWLRVRRVVDVATVSASGLKPMPKLLRAQPSARAFLAVGVHGGVLYLLLDPGRLVADVAASLTAHAGRNVRRGNTK